MQSVGRAGPIGLPRASVCATRAKLGNLVSPEIRNRLAGATDASPENAKDF
jgi:hypothetical protein